jgi:hypothetical protein
VSTSAIIPTCPHFVQTIFGSRYVRYMHLEFAKFDFFYCIL